MKEREADEAVEAGIHNFTIDKTKILEIYQDMSSEEEEVKMKRAPTKRAKKPQFHQENKFTWIGQQQLSKIQATVQQYRKKKSTETISFSHTIRNYKAELIRYLLYGIEEIRKEGIEKRSEQFQLNHKSIFSHVKKIANNISEALFHIKNNSSIREEKREYKNHWRALLQNIKDPENTKLRTKILTGILTGEKIAKMEETDFYSNEKTEKVKQRERRLLAQHEDRFWEKCCEKNESQNSKSKEVKEKLNKQKDKLGKVKNFLDEEYEINLKQWVKNEMENSKQGEKVSKHLEQMFKNI